MNCLPTTTNQEFADSKPLGGFVFRPVKRVPVTPRGLMVDNKVFCWDDSVGFRHFD